MHALASRTVRRRLNAAQNVAEPVCEIAEGK
jgi:hypothetical protein